MDLAGNDGMCDGCIKSYQESSLQAVGNMEGACVTRRGLRVCPGGLASLQPK